MKKLVLALLLGINLASAEGLFKNPNQFQRACQNKISHFYTCKFINLRIMDRLNSIEQEMIGDYYIEARDTIMALDMFHNKSIENYFTPAGKQYLREWIGYINKDFPVLIDEMKNTPNDFYNSVLKRLNNHIKQKGIGLR